MNPLEPRSLRTANATVVYDLAPGDGPALLFIPGWVCPRTHWAEVLESLPAGHRTIVADLPNQGESWSDRSDWSIRDFAEILIRLLESEGCTSVIPIGHSMGGAIAVELAGLVPHLATRVLCVDSLTYDTIYPAQSAEAIEAVVGPLEADFAAAVSAIVQALFVDAAHAELADTVAASMASQPPAAAVGSMRGLLAWDRDAALARTRVRVDILSAEPFLAEGVRDELRGSADISTIHGGHFLPVEAPASTARWIAERVAGGGADR